ncbi:conserved hypothetical protein [Ricinus communis]|uniref:Uncharacterized protein n=1 Tax=Ricinus communis TaxID=3988 RepID=B9TE09_RICCO|nr:conserved hypothetical protein [Ricinus communis]
MSDFLPIQFDQSVICIGPSDTQWPSDLTLLSTLLQPSEQAAGDLSTARSRRRTFVALGGVCVAVAVIAGVGVLSVKAPAKVSMLPADIAAMEEVNRKFAAAHLNELRVSLDGRGGVLVHGLVANESENLAARRLLASIMPIRLQARYDVAEVIRRSIGESLSIAGINVNYEGNGVFSIAGKDIPMEALRRGVEHIRQDLSEDVREIRIDATGPAPPDAPEGASYVSIVSSDSVHYAQTSDGVKHIFIFNNRTAGNVHNANVLPEKHRRRQRLSAARVVKRARLTPDVRYATDRRIVEMRMGEAIERQVEGLVG